MRLALVRQIQPQQFAARGQTKRRRGRRGRRDGFQPFGAQRQAQPFGFGNLEQQRAIHSTDPAGFGYARGHTESGGHPLNLFDTHAVRQETGKHVDLRPTPARCDDDLAAPGPVQAEAHVQGLLKIGGDDVRVISQICQMRQILVHFGAAVCSFLRYNAEHDSPESQPCRRAAETGPRALHCCHLG